MMQLLLHGLDESTYDRYLKAVVIPDLWSLATKNDDAGENSANGAISLDTVLKKMSLLYYIGHGEDEIIYLVLLVEKYWLRPKDKCHGSVSRFWSNLGTMLHMAARCGHESIVAELIRFGADVNARDERQHTPLKEAMRRGKRNVVELLLQHGAEVQHIIMAQDWWRYMEALGLHPSHYDLVLTQEATGEGERFTGKYPQPAVGQSRPVRIDAAKRSHKIVKDLGYEELHDHSKMLM